MKKIGLKLEPPLSWKNARELGLTKDNVIYASHGGSDWIDMLYCYPELLDKVVATLNKKKVAFKKI